MIHKKSYSLRHLFVVSMTSITLTLAAQPTAKEWNKDVVGWNLGNQLESRKRCRFQCHSYSCPLAVPYYQCTSNEH